MDGTCDVLDEHAPLGQAMGRCVRQREWALLSADAAKEALLRAGLGAGAAAALAAMWACEAVPLTVDPRDYHHLLPKAAADADEEATAIACEWYVQRATAILRHGGPCGHAIGLVEAAMAALGGSGAAQRRLGRLLTHLRAFAALLAALDAVAARQEPPPRGKDAVAWMAFVDGAVDGGSRLTFEEYVRCASDDAQPLTAWLFPRSMATIDRAFQRALAEALLDGAGLAHLSLAARLLAAAWPPPPDADDAPADGPLGASLRALGEAIPL